jgi:ABC-type multidrug transport system fused ATPase/permease subunit
MNNAIEMSNSYVLEKMKIEDNKKKQSNKLTLANIVLSFQNVYMSYEKLNKNFALKNVTLEIPKKCKVAFCGT